MCLSIAIQRPADVLARGEHVGHEWMVIHNTMGYRCGYVKVDPGHPWHGKHCTNVAADIHGGLTFSEADVPCGAGGDDDGHWLGFDCAHAWDLPDPALPGGSYLSCYDLPYAEVRSQEYVESECRRLCEQAGAIAKAKGRS